MKPLVIGWSSYLTVHILKDAPCMCPEALIELVLVAEHQVQELHGVVNGCQCDVVRLIAQGTG